MMTFSSFLRWVGWMDLKCKNFWRSLLAEFLGTMFLVLIGCSSCLGAEDWNEEYKPSVVQIALCFGIAVATIVQCIGHISGGHINPAVTLSMLVTGRISIIRAVLYIICQCVGAVTGAGILKGLTPSPMVNSLGMTTVHQLVSDAQAVGLEFFITFVLVCTVFAVTDDTRNDVKGSAPLAIGLSITVCHLGVIMYTGSSMNSARSFGPAVVMGDMDKHWVYWVGPCLGGIVAGLCYKWIFTLSKPCRETNYTPTSCTKDSKEVVTDVTTSI